LWDTGGQSKDEAQLSGLWCPDEKTLPVFVLAEVDSNVVIPTLRNTSLLLGSQRKSQSAGIPIIQTGIWLELKGMLPVSQVINTE
jgi:hypothetical protein